MTGTKFVAIIPGAIDVLGDQHNLSWSARSMLRWLAETVDRETGIVAPVTIKAITAATRCTWGAVKHALGELEDAGAIHTYLPKGHDGHITVAKGWHDRIVWKKGSHKRGSEHGNRGSERRKRGYAIGNRASAIGNRASAEANRENGDREREEQRVLRTLSSGGASNAAPPLNGAGDDGAADADKLILDQAFGPLRQKGIRQLVQTTKSKIIHWECNGDLDNDEAPRDLSEQFDHDLDDLGYWITDGPQQGLPVDELDPHQIVAIRALCHDMNNWISTHPSPLADASWATTSGSGDDPVSNWVGDSAHLREFLEPPDSRQPSCLNPGELGDYEREW